MIVSRKTELMPVLVSGLLLLSVLPGCAKHLTASAEDRSAMTLGLAARTAAEPQREPAPPARVETGRGETAGAETAGADKEVRVMDQSIAVASASSAPSAGVEPSTLDGQTSSLGDVFFDYDRFTLRTEAEPVLNLNARFLKKKEGTFVIAGHCDERGTAAYNLVLGEKRARSVQRYLEDLGVAPSRMRVISYGKEKPFCRDHSAQCWQTNRRAHFSLP